MKEQLTTNTVTTPTPHAKVRKRQKMQQPDSDLHFGIMNSVT
jgi:hypothetical protein